MGRKGYNQRGQIIVTDNGDICCTNTDCTHISGIGLCTDENSDCKYSSDRSKALLAYMFDDDKEVEIQLIN